MAPLGIALALFNLPIGYAGSHIRTHTHTHTHTHTTHTHTHKVT